MENATKALLIAAAVLIAILLISLGVGVFNSASEQVGNADLSEYDAQKFNEKFTKYVSTNCSGSEVNALLDTVVTSNNAVGQTNFVKVTVTGYTTSNVNAGRVTKYPTKVPTGSRFSVEVTKLHDKTGLVTEITVGAGK